MNNQKEIEQEELTNPIKKKRKTNNNNQNQNQKQNQKQKNMKTIERSVLPSQLFFTTQRFKTPAKQNHNETTTKNQNQKTTTKTTAKTKTTTTTTTESSSSSSSSPSSSSSSSSSFTPITSKQRDTTPVHYSSPRSNHPHNSSHQEQPPLNQNKITPRITKNPHIYGKQDLQNDAEMSLVIAETPKQRKNREFRRGKSKPIDPLNQPVTKLSAQSLQAFDSIPSRSRRGSRASSIGSGHEALPHPRVPPSTLCRHIRTDLPPAMRCRTLLSWSTQKAEDLTYKTINPQQFQPTRFIIDELPKTILNSFNNQSKLISPILSSSSSKFSHPHSKRILKIVKSTIKLFIKGICENQVEINWAPTDKRLNGISYSSDEEVDIHPTIDFNSLPVHPQDLKNERKIKELDDWRTRMSYEDNARQYQLTRYGKLIERLNEKEEPAISTASSSTMKENMNQEGEELGRINTKKLTDRESILEYGRFLRRQEAALSPVPRSIDALLEHGSDWSHLSSNVGMISENMTRIEGKVTEISQKSRELLTSSTYKLQEVSSDQLAVGVSSSGGSRMSTIEAKMLLSSMDGIQLCLKSLNLFSSCDDRLLRFSSHMPPSSQSGSGSGKILSLDTTTSTSSRPPHSLGKRDLLRALSRSS